MLHRWLKFLNEYGVVLLTNVPCTDEAGYEVLYMYIHVHVHVHAHIRFYTVVCTCVHAVLCLFPRSLRKYPLICKKHSMAGYDCAY